MKTRLKKGEDFVSTFSYPTWEQLPELDLYLDQVLLYVNKTCAPVLSSSDKGLTAAMINNYVKHGWPVRPPASTPEADSMNVVTVEVPVQAPATVPMASDSRASFIWGMLPS